MVAGGGRGDGAKRSTTGTKTNSKRRPKKIHLHKQQKHLVQLMSVVSAAASASHSFLSHHDLHLLPSQTLILECLLSAASISLSTLTSLLHPHATKPPELISPPQPCWFFRFLSSASNEYDRRWLDNFRMSKQSFTLLLRILTPSLQHSLPSIPPNYALAAALFRLAHGAPYKAVARRFGLDSEGACRAFYTICKVVNDKLGHMFELRSDIRRIVVGFGWISLPNCCGVLGFSRFPLEGELLGKDGDLMVQALVDSEGRFLDVSAGWPSTLKPETIFRQTKLYLGVEESRELLNGSSFELNGGNSIPQYILGDSCFPLLPWLLTPFVKSSEGKTLSPSDRAFNAVHSRGMRLVNTAFGRVRVQWQLLSRPWMDECLEAFPFVIVAGCLLHNFLIKCSEPLPDENAVCLTDPKLPVFQGEVDENGRRIRDVLALHLSRVSLRR